LHGGGGAIPATVEWEKSAVAPRYQTEHGKAKKGRRNGAGRASHGEQCSMAMAAAKQGVTDLALT
jgi:hypothetical protein